MDSKVEYQTDLEKIRYQNIFGSRWSIGCIDLPKKSLHDLIRRKKSFDRFCKGQFLLRN